MELISGAVKSIRDFFNNLEHFRIELDRLRIESTLRLARGGQKIDRDELLKNKMGPNGPLVDFDVTSQEGQAFIHRLEAEEAQCRKPPEKHHEIV